MDDVKEKVIGLLPRVIEKRISGEATVSQLFEIQLKRRESLKVAGCRVSNGLLEKNKPVRVVRAGDVVFEGEPHASCTQSRSTNYLMQVPCKP
jgi:translation initiation factor IF-2